MTGESRRGGAHDRVSRVLVVDDDASLRERLRVFLGQEGVEVTEAASGEEALRVLATARFDALLLDVVMPGMDGLELMRRVRAGDNVPILLLTARDSETDHVLGLELGADDYIAKPFRARELLARIRSVLRRAGGQLRDEPLSVGGIEVDLRSRTATLRGGPLAISGMEFDLLVAFLRNRGRVLAREALLSDAGRNHVTVSERTVDVHISRLRKKLGDDPRTPHLIKTVHGVGYVFTG